VLKKALKTITDKNFIFFLLLLALLSLNAITPAGFFLRKTDINIELITIFFLAIPAYSSFIKKEKIKKIKWLMVLVTVITSTLVSLFFYWAEFNLYPNFTLSKFRIHPDQFALIPLAFTALLLIEIDKNKLKRLNKALFCLFPLLIFPLLIIIKQAYPTVFNFVVAEDSILEYLGFALYLVTAFFAAKTVKNILKIKMDHSKKIILTIFFALITVASILIAGEEISWGQRIFNIATPEEYATQNHQNELNLHNNEDVFHYVYVAYFYLGLYGGLAWIIRLLSEKFFPKKKVTKWAETLIPNWNLALYFLPSAIYSRLRTLYGAWTFNKWEELMELALVIGITLFVHENYKNIKKRFEQKKGKIKKNGFLISILIFSLVTKLTLVIFETVPFKFDQGKDSMAILHMVKTFSPKLIGPWTSIPGLFFGPGWYYLLGPAYLLSNGNPLAPIFMMIALNLLTIYLAYKHFGKLEAIIFATVDAFIMLATSAWNPFPMPLLMLLILIILKKKKLNFKDFFCLAILASLAFHFSSAYAFFYIIALPLLIVYRAIKNKNKITLKKVFAAITGFLIPFLPQLAFELRNNFVETKAVLNYLQNPPANQTKTPLREVVTASINELKITTIPQFNFPELEIINKIILLIFALATLWGIFLLIKRKKKINLLAEIIVFVVIPIIGLSKLHFNLWYLYSIFPIAIIFLSQFFKELPKKLILLITLLYLLNPIEKLAYFFKYDKNNLDQDIAFLATKNEVLDRIEELSNKESYSSYHYLPDIYDYPYQYLYFQRAFKGEKLPYEFSYKPGEISYIKEKPELLKKVDVFEKNPESIFFVVEKPENQDFLDEWWNHQNYGEIILEEKLSETVTLYQATPKN
jgi:hypothetical protein